MRKGGSSGARAQRAPSSFYSSVVRERGPRRASACQAGRPPAGPRRFGGAVVLGPGFEPGFYGSEPFVLPLDEPSMSVRDCLAWQSECQSESTVGRPGFEPGGSSCDSGSTNRSVSIAGYRPVRVMSVGWEPGGTAETSKGHRGFSPRWPFVQLEWFSKLRVSLLGGTILAATAGKRPDFNGNTAVLEGHRPWPGHGSQPCGARIGAPLHATLGDVGRLRVREVM